MVRSAHTNTNSHSVSNNVTLNFSAEDILIKHENLRIVRNGVIVDVVDSTELMLHMATVTGWLTPTDVIFLFIFVTHANPNG